MTRRAREIETLAMTAFAALPLYVTNAVGKASLVAFHVVILATIFRVAIGKGPEVIPSPLMRFLAIAYVPFYVIDAAAISRSTIAASTHLVLFVAAYQPIESMQKRNQAQRLLTAALIFVASLATSTHITIVLFVIAFAWLMLRQLMYLAHLDTAQAIERPYDEAPSGRAAVFYLAGAVLIGALLFPFLPRVRNPLVQGFTGSLPGATTALSDTINFNEPRVTSNDGTMVARVWMNRQAIPFFTPLRLRGTVYDRFARGEWRQSTYGRRPIAPRDGTYVLARPDGIQREAVVQMRPMRGRLFLPVGTFAVSGLPNLAEGPTRDAYHVLHMRSGEAFDFNVRMATRIEPLRVTRMPRLQYPIRPEVAELARRIVGDEQSLEGRAARIERHLSTTFRYEANPATLPRGMSVERFLLQEKRGHCEYFAAGMVVLLTSLDVPARMVGGFYGGRLNPLTGYFIVRREDAHAWVEVWDGAEWITYDPTPASLRPGNAAQGFAQALAAAIGDSITYFWDRYILTYGLGDQITLAADAITRLQTSLASARQSLAAGARNLRSQAFVFVMASLLVAGLTLILFARRRRPLFDLLAAHLARLGIHVGPSMTMEDALRSLREHHPDAAIELEPLVRMYEEEEFSARRDSGRRRELRRRLAELGVVLLVFLASVPAEAQRRRPVSPSGVPAQYQVLHSAIDAGLDQWLAYLNTRTPVPGHRITFAAEILTANVNRGGALLRPDAIAGVRLYLDRLAQLGVQAASISIGYPVLDPSFPRSDEYLAFYREVAREVRLRGMKLHVESGVVFANTAFSDLDVDFSGLTLSRYLAGKRVMAERVLEHMRPDFLGLGGEPDTEAALTGLSALNDADVYASSIQQIVKGLDKRGANVGAGVGTWSPLRFAERLAEIAELDAITMHIYPVWKTPIENATLISAAARARGKRITLDEAWLYKAAPAEATNIAANEAIFKRDAFDFWTPLDEKFLTILARLAAVEGIDVVSPFWTTLFYGTLRWSPGLEALPYGAVVQRVNEVALANLVSGRPSALGEHYAALIRQSRH